MLVLGGGWTGVRFAQRSGRKVTVTTRTAEKMNAMIGMGLDAIRFDLEDESSWTALPKEGPVVITFGLDEKHIPHYEKLWDQYLKDRPVFVLAAISVFDWEPTNRVITEDSPLTGKSMFTGKAQESKVNGEKWVLAKGGSILYLSGICSDIGDGKEDETGTVMGGDRSIKSFFDKGYVKNGLKVMNVIHVNDICKILEVVLSKAGT